MESLAEQVGAVRLRKLEGTAAARDRSAPVLPGGGRTAEAASVEQFKNKIHAVNLENWYPLLKEHTFATEFIDLSIQEARAFVREYDRLKGKNAHEALKEEDALTLRSIEAKIDDRLARFKEAGGFVRLSTRSPKDAVINSEDMLKEWKAELVREQAQDNENARLIALIKVSTMALKVRSGKEALALIKASERSNEDLLLALEFPDQWDMKIVIREWAVPRLTCIPPFRGFVCKKKLTALSQYFHIAFFPVLAQHKDEIAQAIRKYFAEHIAALIPLDNYVIDFGITSACGGAPTFGDRAEELRVLVIELNPFNDYTGCGTDPGLFNWKSDRSVVDGDAPFEFRVREAEFDVKPNLIMQWRDLIAIP